MTTTDPLLRAALLLRVVLGALFLTHATVLTCSLRPLGVATVFASMGLPASLGLVTLAVELLAGAGLILGIATRILSLVTAAIPIGFMALGHTDLGWRGTDPTDDLALFAFWAAALALQAILGDGVCAVRADPVA